MMMLGAATTFHSELFDVQPAFTSMRNEKAADAVMPSPYQIFTGRPGISRNRLAVRLLSGASSLPAENVERYGADPSQLGLVMVEDVDQVHTSLPSIRRANAGDDRSGPSWTRRTPAFSEPCS